MSPAAMRCSDPSAVTIRQPSSPRPVASPTRSAPPGSITRTARPSVTQRVFVIPPGSQIGPITAAQRQALIDGSLVAGVYEKSVDRESAYEKLKGRAVASGATPAPTGTASVPGATPAPADGGGGLMGGLKDVLFGSTGPRGGKHEGLAESAARSAVRSIGSSVGREIIRGVLGSLLGGGRKR